MDVTARGRFQFSLRQLITVTIITAAVLYIVLCRESWRLKRILPGIIHDPQVALTLDDSKIITVQTDSANIYDIESGQRLLSIPGAITAAAISESGRFAAVGTKSGEIEIWNIATSTKQTQFAAHKAEIESLSFSADGRFLISSSTDLVARVWDAVSGRAKAELIGHTGLIQRAYLSADGSTALTVSDRGWGRDIDPKDASKTLWGDNIERIWDTRTKAVLKSGTRRLEQTPGATVVHEALSDEDCNPYIRVSNRTRDRRLTIIRPSYGSPWCIDSRSYTFEFTNCVGARAHAFFGHNEDIAVTCPFESIKRETTIWQRLNSSKLSRLTYWWSTRVLALAILVYVIYIIARIWQRRKSAIPKK